MNLLQLLATGAPPPPTYIEDVFSAYTYTGNGSTQTITNGIDLSTNGGLVWTKVRDSAAQTHSLQDSARSSFDTYLNTASTAAEATDATIAGTSTGYNITAGGNNVNWDTHTFVSWTFRKAAKFFDVVTYTGDGVAGRTIAHSLGVAPGMIVIKKTTDSSDWKVWHRSLSDAARQVELNSTGAAFGGTSWFGTAAQQTSSVFTLGDLSLAGDHVNSSGPTYVAYLFAHDTSTTGLIQCGSFTTDGSGNATVTLGWEAQYFKMKCSSAVEEWNTLDTSRGWTNQPSGVNDDWNLNDNSTAADAQSNRGYPTANGFYATNLQASKTYIYLAIRRGPMKLPTAGTQVYNAIARTGTGAAATVTGVGFPPDLVFTRYRAGAVTLNFWDRLRGALIRLQTASTSEEGSQASSVTSYDMDGMSVGTHTLVNGGATNYINHFFRRYPGVFDEVCYTGTGSAHTEAHNLTVVPELMIGKTRAATGHWGVYHKDIGAANALLLSATNASFAGNGYWNSTTPTASVFTVGTETDVNQNTMAQVMYLFATLAGISKVGTYTGNGSSQTINCGFAAGARFVLIKRTDSTGNWVVFDSTRGIVAGNDPYLLLNSTAAEDTDEDAVDTDNSGFIVNETTAAVNTNTATYIYLAIS